MCSMLSQVNVEMIVDLAVELCSVNTSSPLAVSNKP